MIEKYQHVFSVQNVHNLKMQTIYKTKAVLICIISLFKAFYISLNNFFRHVLTMTKIKEAG